MANKLKMFMDVRSEAVARGDRRLQRTMDVEIARLGYRVPEGPFISVEGPQETTQAVGLMEQAVPEKPRKGRPPKPRCEHDMLLDRCPDCSLEGT